MAAEPEEATAAAPPAESDKVDILLVDDRPDKLLALESILSSLDQNLVRAYSGREALRALLQQDYAVILLDVNMPGMDGFETAEMIRKRERSQKTPIIFFTAMSEVEAHVFKSYSLGAVDFIRTPVVPEILKAKVSVFVDLFKKTEQVKRQAEQVRLLQEREHESRMAEAAGRLDAEAKRNRFFTLALDMLGIADFTGTLRQVNPSWGKTLGYTDEELKSRSFLEYVHPDDRVATEAQLESLTHGNAVPYFETRFATRAGGYRWLAWTAAPYTEEGLLYIYARDLSETRRAEEERVKLIREQTARAAAEASERRAAFLAEAATALTASLDYAETLARLVHLAVPTLGDWAFIDVAEEGGAVNRLEVAHAQPEDSRLAENLRQAVPSMEGAGPQSEVLRCGQPVLVAEALQASLEGPQREAVEAIGARSMMVVPLVARERCLAALTVVSAKSGRKYDRNDLELAAELARRAALAVDNARLYRASQEARKTAEKANRAKDEFLATLSHELRTPLTPILGWTVMLRSGNLDPPAVLRGLEVIERNVRAQTQLIGDLLDVSRIITGKLRLEVRPIDLPPVIEAGVDAVRPSAEAKEIRLNLDLAPGLPQVLGDPDRLQQVVWNLVSNAVKFTPQHGQIDVVLRKEDSHITLQVRDTGKGISADFLPYVFDRFRQADSTSTRSHGGLGLGLAIVRHLVELHGGTVDAASRGDGEGAVFTVNLPLMVPAEHGDGPRPPGAGADAAEEVRLDGVKVLVLEDENDVRDFLSVSLVQYGAEVAAFATTQEALSALEREKPHVLVSDIGMPGEDGYEFIRRVRLLGPDQGGQIPAAALTAHAKGEDGARVLTAGFQVHLAKPVQPAELASVVATLAGKQIPAP
jgi:PAS domain S-box-containing protein